MTKPRKCKDDGIPAPNLKIEDGDDMAVTKADGEKESDGMAKTKIASGTEGGGNKAAEWSWRNKSGGAEMGAAPNHPLVGAQARGCV